MTPLHNGPPRSASALAVLRLAFLLGACASSALAQGIFSCTDAHGRKLTADRPIPECRDREQTELNANGSVRRKIAPEPTAQEREARQAQAQRDTEQQIAQNEEKRRARALLIRYPHQAAHDKERRQALEQVDVAIQSAQKRLGTLAQQRKTIDAEMEFFKKDPTKAPASLTRQATENTQNTRAQDRFIADQENEKKRIDARFDQEQAKLRPMWERGAPAPVTPAPASAVR